MAEMKHAKKPRRPAPRLPKEPRPLPGGRPQLGGRRSFKAELAREFGVTEVPKSLELRTQKTLDSLPERLPTRPRPVLRAFKSLAAAAAVLAISSASLLGLNTTYPQLTEALPGLGPVFMAMNGRQNEATPSPSPTPNREPGFQPVTALNKGDFPGILTVDDAWSDGKSLYLDLCISPYEDFYDIIEKLGGTENTSLWPTIIRTDKYGEPYSDFDSSLKVYSGNDFCGKEGAAFPAFQYDGDKFRARWDIDLEGLEADEELKVEISIPSLGTQPGYDDSSLFTWSPAFEAVFALPVSKGGNRVFGLQGSDGPVLLRSVDYSPSRVSFDLSMPYLGQIGDILPNDDYSDIPLGLSSRLTCTGPDGSTYIFGSSDDSPEYLGSQDPELSEQIDLRYTFTTLNAAETVDPRELKGPLVLTLYDFPREDLDSPGYGRRVTAEFTIDLSTGRAYASENYLQEGFEKGSASMTTLDRLDEASYDGLLLMPGSFALDSLNTASDPMSYFVLTVPAEYAGREMAVNGYLDGSSVSSFFFAPGTGSDSPDGQYSSAAITIHGRDYIEVSVTVFYPQWLLEEYGYTVLDRLELIDSSTGKVIIDDLEAAYMDTAEKLLGTSPGTAAASETDGTASSP